MICGLDISTSVVGVSVLNDDGSFHSIHHIDLKKIKSFYQKVDEVLGFLVHKLELPHDVKFYIESPLLMFAANKSMISTLMLLQKFNACVCYGIYRSFGVEPILISAATARKTIGLKLPKKIGKKQTKPIVLDFVQKMNIIPNSTWVLKKTGKPKDYTFDMCDAFVIAYSAFLSYNAKVYVRKA